MSDTGATTTMPASVGTDLDSPVRITSYNHLWKGFGGDKLKRLRLTVSDRSARDDTGMTGTWLIHAEDRRQLSLCAEPPNQTSAIVEVYEYVTRMSVENSRRVNYDDNWENTKVVIVTDASDQGETVEKDSDEKKEEEGDIA